MFALLSLQTLSTQSYCWDEKKKFFLFFLRVERVGEKILEITSNKLRKW